VDDGWAENVSDEISVGDRVHFVAGPNQGVEGEVTSVSSVIDERRVLLIKTDAGKRLVALPKEVQKIERLIH
jgi:ribosomal protein L24